MKRSVAWFLAAVLSLTSLAIAGDLQSGLQPGEYVEAFIVEKIGGAVNDGVEPGEYLCYRCQLGGKPVVLIFARSTNGALTELIKELDKSIAKYEDQKLSSFVSLIGEDQEKLKTDGKQFASKNKVERVALVVPDDYKNGPDVFNINPDAEFTVILYHKGEVVANHAYKAGELDTKGVQTILDDTKKILE